jgi:uncharacterized protein (TIRG00374 family)
MPRPATILRLVCSFLLLAFLFTTLDLAPLRQVIGRFRGDLYTSAVALLFGSLLLQSVILTRLLALRGATLRVRDVYRLGLAAGFFGAFVPGSGGPDLVLCINLRRSGIRTEDALGTVLTMRAAGLFTMILFAFCVSFTSRAPHTAVRTMTGALAAAFVFLWVVVASDRGRRTMKRWAGALERFQLTAVAYRTYASIAEATRDTRTHVLMAPVYVGLALLKIGADYLIARSLGFDIPFTVFFVVVPLVVVLTQLPVSISGIGVRESGYAGLFALLGLPAGDAVAISLGSFTLALWIVAAGALAYGLHGATLTAGDPRPTQ